MNPRQLSTLSRVWIEQLVFDKLDLDFFSVSHWRFLSDILFRHRCGWQLATVCLQIHLRFTCYKCILLRRDLLLIYDLDIHVVRSTEIMRVILVDFSVLSASGIYFFFWYRSVLSRILPCWMLLMKSKLISTFGLLWKLAFWIDTFLIHAYHIDNLWRSRWTFRRPPFTEVSLLDLKFTQVAKGSLSIVFLMNRQAHLALNLVCLVHRLLDIFMRYTQNILI